MNRFELSGAHARAANRRRRVILDYDAFGYFGHCDIDGALGSGMSAYLATVFGDLDRVEHSVDAIYWDIMYNGEDYSVYPSRILPRRREGIFGAWADAGLDVWSELIRGAQARGIESMLVERICEVPCGGAEHPPTDRIAHPERYIKCWCAEGMANLASSELRERKLSILAECVDNYPFEGLQVDFCRHTPFLEPGRQWELREHATEYMRMLRRMLLKRETGGRTLLLSARVPDTVAGCNADGLDIETWASEGIVDSLTIGSRSFSADIEDFRARTKGRVKLYPCYDQHHTMDAYAFPSDEVYRGVFSNLWARGADGMTLFNWLMFTAEEFRALVGADYKFSWMLDDARRAFGFIGDPEKMRGRDKTYVVERKGGYPWEEGYANNNMCKSLPLPLSNRGDEATVSLYACDPVARERESVEAVTLDLIFYGLRETDAVRARLNGARLAETARDANWRDDEINAPNKEYVSGYNIKDLPSKADRPLSRLTFPVDPGSLAAGENFVSVSLSRGAYPYCDSVSLEKVELNVRYKK